MPIDRESRWPHGFRDDLQESSRGGTEIEDPRPRTDQPEALHELLELERAPSPESSLLGALEVMIFRPVRLAHGSDPFHSIRVSDG